MSAQLRDDGRASAVSATATVPSSAASRPPSGQDLDLITRRPAVLTKVAACDTVDVDAAVKAAR